MILDLARSARDLLRAESGASGGHGTLLGRLTDLLYYGDFEIFEQVASISDADHTNLVGFRPGQSDTGGLLLSAPLGTGEGAPPPASRGRRERGPTLRDGRVWGAGASSGRLALLCQIIAASSFAPGKLRRPVIVAGTFGEEHRGSGTRFVLESGKFQPEWVVVGASTNLELVRAHRGYLLFRIDLSERGEPWRRGFPVRSSYHVVLPGDEPSRAPWGRRGGAFEQGLAVAARLLAKENTSIHGFDVGESVNRAARRCAFDVLSTDDSPPDLPWDAEATPLPEGAKLSVPQQGCIRAWMALQDRLERLLARRPHTKSDAEIDPADEGDFEPTGALWNIGRVETTAAGLTVWFDYRPLPGEDAYAMFQQVERLVGETMTKAAPDVAIDVCVTINRPAMEASADSPLTRAAERALCDERLIPVGSTFPFYTDGAMYASCGLDTVVFGPGWWGNAAASGVDSIPVRHLELAVDVYRRMIAELCA